MGKSVAVFLPPRKRILIILPHLKAAHTTNPCLGPASQAEPASGPSLCLPLVWPGPAFGNSPEEVPAAETGGRGACDFGGRALFWAVPAG